MNTRLNCLLIDVALTVTFPNSFKLMYILFWGYLSSADLKERNKNTRNVITTQFKSLEFYRLRIDNTRRKIQLVFVRKTVRQRIDLLVPFVQPQKAMATNEALISLNNPQWIQIIARFMWSFMLTRQSPALPTPSKTPKQLSQMEEESKKKEE